MAKGRHSLGLPSRCTKLAVTVEPCPSPGRTRRAGLPSEQLTFPVKGQRATASGLAGRLLRVSLCCCSRKATTGAGNRWQGLWSNKINFQKQAASWVRPRGHGLGSLISTVVFSSRGSPAACRAGRTQIPRLWPRRIASRGLAPHACQGGDLCALRAPRRTRVTVRTTARDPG